MQRTWRSLFGVLVAGIIFADCFVSASHADDAAAKLLPGTTVAYVRISQIPETVDAALAHPVIARIQAHSALNAAYESPDYKKFRFGLKFIEAQLDMSWNEAVKKLMHGGVTVAVDAATEGLVIISKAEDEDSLASIMSTLMEVARLDAENKGKPDPYEQTEYRDVTVYRTKDGAFAMLGDQLVIVNKPELGRSVVDAILETREDSLAADELFQAAQADASDSAMAWGYVNLRMVRDSGEAEEMFRGRAEDFGGELILGGLLEAFKETDYLVAELSLDPQSAGLSFRVPYERGQTPEVREHFFGPAGTGEARRPKGVPGRLMAISAYRNISQMWLRAGDLFDEKTNDELAKAETGLSTLFAGKDFVLDILGKMGANIQVIVANQEFAEDRPIPAIKLPAFALLVELEEADKTGKEFRRLFQNAIGFFNVVGAMNGQPQLEFDFENYEGADITLSRFVPEPDEEGSTDAKINFSFSPTLATTKTHLILSSGQQLARDLVTAVSDASTNAEEAATIINTLIELNAQPILESLKANESHLVAQNMLKEGHTREEAETQIGILFEIIELFKKAEATLETTETMLSLGVEIELADEAVTGKGE